MSSLEDIAGSSSSEFVSRQVANTPWRERMNDSPAQVRNGGGSDSFALEVDDAINVFIIRTGKNNPTILRKIKRLSIDHSSRDLTREGICTNLVLETGKYSVRVSIVSIRKEETYCSEHCAVFATEQQH
jgi:hypothetical protein